MKAEDEGNFISAFSGRMGYLKSGLTTQQTSLVFKASPAREETLRPKSDSGLGVPQRPHWRAWAPSHS